MGRRTQLHDEGAKQQAMTWDSLEIEGEQGHNHMKGLRQENYRPWPGSSVGWSFLPICQGCRFDPQSGHMQESTNVSMGGWSNKWMLASLSLKSINFFKKIF